MILCVFVIWSKDRQLQVIQKSLGHEQILQWIQILTRAISQIRLNENLEGLELQLLRKLACLDILESHLHLGLRSLHTYALLTHSQTRCPHWLDPRIPTVDSQTPWPLKSFIHGVIIKITARVWFMKWVTPNKGIPGFLYPHRLSAWQSGALTSCCVSAGHLALSAFLNTGKSPLFVTFSEQFQQSNFPYRSGNSLP